MIVGVTAVAVLYVNFDPRVVGDEATASVPQDVFGPVLRMPPPPLPEDIDDTAASRPAPPPAEGRGAGDTTADTGAPSSTSPNSGKTNGGQNDDDPPVEKPDPENQQPSASANDRATGAEEQPRLTGRFALLFQEMLLQRGIKQLEQIDSYTATFTKRERIGGVLSDSQVIQLKLRHSPFSVVMEWKQGGDVGRRALYAEGQNAGKLLVRVGGLKGRFLPVVHLDPMGDLACSECRYPVKKAGVLEAAKLALQYRQEELNAAPGAVACRMYDGYEFDGQPCFCFVLDYRDRSSVSAAKIYRRSTLYISKTTLFPVVIQNFGWPDEPTPEKLKTFDEDTLVEYYTFSNIKTDKVLAAEAFEPKALGGRLR